MSSLSKATVFRVNGLRKHPNADNLMISEFEGCPYIVNSHDTSEGDLRIWVPFDMIPPNESWVGEFVRGKRVRSIRLRGIFSMGVCLPIPKGCEASEGEDVTTLLGFTKWEPPECCDDGIISSKNGYTCSGPSGLVLSKYDLDNLRKYYREFSEADEVAVTLKIDGENISVVYWDGQFHVRSRNRWIAEGDNKWWNSFRLYNWEFLRDYPGYVVIGEKYGNIPKFRYDCPAGEQRIRVFDIFDSNKMRFLSFGERENFLKDGYIPTVPLLYKGLWKGLDNLVNNISDRSILNDGLEEGFVVECATPRWTAKGDRMKFKYHFEKYLCWKGKLK